MAAAGERRNLHATAIVLGVTGVLFTGPSGSGKSMLAFACMAAARRAGLHAALIADDQVFVEQHGAHLVARRPEAIAGLMEFRGAGVGRVESLPHALIHLAVRPINLATSERLPPEGERFPLDAHFSLPLLRLPVAAPDPFAQLCAFWPQLAGQSPEGPLPPA